MQTSSTQTRAFPKYSSLNQMNSHAISQPIQEGQSSDYQDTLAPNPEQIMLTMEFVDQSAYQNHGSTDNGSNNKENDAMHPLYDIREINHKVHGRVRAKSSQRLHRPGLTSTNFHRGDGSFKTLEIDPSSNKSNQQHIFNAETHLSRTHMSGTHLSGQEEDEKLAVYKNSAVSSLINRQLHQKLGASKANYQRRKASKIIQMNTNSRPQQLGNKYQLRSKTA